MNVLSRFKFVVVSVIITLTVLLYSCTKADVQFGGQYVDDEYAQLVMVDTVVPIVKTTYIDSFQSSSSGSGLIGSYIDPELGKIQATSYFQLQPPTYSSNNEDSFRYSIYDSITLLIKYQSGNYYGDTSSPLTLNVNRLNENIAQYSNFSFMFNTQEFSYFPTPIGSKTITLRPNMGSFFDTVSIRLDDVLGADLWSKITTSNSVIQTADQFKDYFKGIRLSTNQGNGFVAGIKDSLVMRIHYRSQTDAAVTNQVASFTLYDNTYQFNHIDIDRAGTQLGNAGISTAKNEIPSESTNNRAFLQSTTGTLIKLQFPSLKNISNIPGFIKVTRALLKIQPILGSYQGFYPLPAQLKLSETDFNNRIGSDLASGGGAQYGSLYQDGESGTNTMYTYDLTSYIQSKLSSTQTIDGDGLLLNPISTAFNNKFNRLIMGNYYAPQYSAIRLQIFYLATK